MRRDFESDHEHLAADSAPGTNVLVKKFQNVDRALECRKAGPRMLHDRCS